MKPFLTGTLLLAVGIALGWWARGTLPSLPHRTQRVSTVAQAERIIAASAKSPAVKASPAAEPPKFTATDRVKNLAAMTRRGRNMFSVNAIAGTKLDTGFIEMYGLTEAEAASLNASLAAANARMTELALQQATAQTDDTAKTLTVHVPPFPDAGGVVHDQIFAAFRTVLGPERFDAFNALSADGVEAAFSAFGLNDTTYVMKLTPAGPGRKGDAPYDVEAKYNTTAKGTWGSSHSTLFASTIADNFPVLAHYIPPALVPPKK